ncbi:hypothetical protein GH714_018275 [Hevea brasiliensis]|uniref:Uncharacterized protein n=1 Tax=Hevea brasiliensis TaxID=3981 RepID=A0A6A6KST2_HEVBR|nr:hypothetical protein GH714_018275 [Hevea brasiliensis]
MPARPDCALPTLQMTSFPDSFTLVAGSPSQTFLFALPTEQVRSGDASATELFELGAVYNALGVSYVRDGKLDKGIAQFETAVRFQPGYVTAWNNLGDAYEKKKDLKSALKSFEEVLLFDPNNKVARPRRDALKDRVQMYKGVPVKSKDR